MVFFCVHFRFSLRKKKPYLISGMCIVLMDLVADKITYITKEKTENFVTLFPSTSKKNSTCVGKLCGYSSFFNWNKNKINWFHSATHCDDWFIFMISTKWFMVYRFFMTWLLLFFRFMIHMQSNPSIRYFHTPNFECT